MPHSNGLASRSHFHSSGDAAGATVSKTRPIPTISPGRPDSFKTPIKGPIFVARTKNVRDGQADLKITAASTKPFGLQRRPLPKWRDELRMPDMPVGAFGENLTISGLSEDAVRIGESVTLGM